MAVAAGGSLLDHFAALSDPRQAWKVVYPLPEVLPLVLCGTLAGAEDFVETRRWGVMHRAFLERFLPYARGIPSHDTLGDVVCPLDGDLFADCFTSWVEDLRDAGPEFVAVDGETSRCTHDRASGRGPLHLVSALWIGLRRSSPSGRIAARWPAASGWCSASRRARPSRTRSRPSRCCWSAWRRRARS